MDEVGDLLKPLPKSDGGFLFLPSFSFRQSWRQQPVELQGSGSSQEVKLPVGPLSTHWPSEGSANAFA